MFYRKFNICKKVVSSTPSGGSFVVKLLKKKLLLDLSTLAIAFELKF